MTAKFLALVVCMLCLLALLDLWLFIASPSFERVTHGVPLELRGSFTLQDLTPLMTDGSLPWELEMGFENANFAPLVALILVILLIFDAHTIFQRYANYRRVRQPADNPLGFALLRMRRYLFVPIAIGWLMAYCHGTGLEVKAPGMAAFVLAAVLARRGEDDTYGSMLGYACECLSHFYDGFSGRR